MIAPSTERRIIEGIRAKSVPRRYLLAILKAVADLDGERALEVVDQARLLLQLARLSDEERDAILDCQPGSAAP